MAVDIRLVHRDGAERAVHGQLTVTLTAVAGRRPHEVLPALRLLAAVQPGDRVTLDATCDVLEELGYGGQVAG
jgi:hypothetical protein